MLYRPSFALTAAAFIAAVVLSYPARFIASVDLSVYLASAGLFVQGGGFTSLGHYDPTRAAYVLMLAGLKGLGLTDLFYVLGFQALWFGILVASLFALAYRLFGLPIALASVVIILASPDILKEGPRHLDHIWPVGCLLSAYLLYSDTGKPTVAHSLAAAALVAFALFVKEVAIAFVFLPALLIYVMSYSKEKWVLSYYASFFLAVSLGAAFIYFSMPSIADRYSTLSEGPFSEEFTQLRARTILESLRVPKNDFVEEQETDLLETIGGAATYYMSLVGEFFAGLTTFNSGITSRFPLIVPFLMMIVLYTGVLWHRGTLADDRNRNFVYALMLLALCLPLTFVCVALDLRFTQNLLFILLVVPAGLHVLHTSLMSLKVGRYQVAYSLVAALLATVSATQGKVSFADVYESSSLAVLLGKTEIEQRFMREVPVNHVDIIERHVQAGDIVYADFRLFGQSVPFFTEAINYRMLPALFRANKDWACHFDQTGRGSDLVFMVQPRWKDQRPLAYFLNPSEISAPANASDLQQVFIWTSRSTSDDPHSWFSAHEQITLLESRETTHTVFELFKVELPLRPVVRSKPAIYVGRHIGNAAFESQPTGEAKKASSQIGPRQKALLEKVLQECSSVAGLGDLTVLKSGQFGPYAVIDAGVSSDD